MEQDILFPVLYPQKGSANPVLSISLVDSKIKDVPTTHPLSDLTLDLMAECTDNFDSIIVAAEKLKRNTIAITGLARSGKDTLCDIMLSEITAFRKVALGDAVREVRKIIYGETAKKDRHELVLIGQSLRNEDERIWIKAWLRNAINTLITGAQGIIVTDVRQLNEFNYFSQFATTIHVNVNEAARLKVLEMVDGFSALDQKLLNNITEQYTDFFSEYCTYKLINNYDDTFHEVAVNLAKELKKQRHV